MSAPAPGQPLDRPAVGIRLAGDVPAETVRAIGWGLEEEGIPFTVETAAATSAGSLAHAAARRSRLGVGIGIAVHTGQAALQHRDLPADQPLFTLSLAARHPDDLLRLGANAARLVKGNPLSLDEAAPPRPADGAAAATTPRAELVERIATEVVRVLALHPPHR